MAPFNAPMSNDSMSSGPCTPKGDNDKELSMRRSHRRTVRTALISTIQLLIFISIVGVTTTTRFCNAFTPLHVTRPIQQRQANLPPTAATTLDTSPSSYEMSNFANRMKNLMNKDTQRTKKRKVARGPKNLVRLTTLQDFKKVVGDEKERLVVVRWYAPWCKACKAIAPSFYRLASIFPNVVFVDVPVTPENANLHQGLGVPSLPYSHIYHPTGRLVEELKISKKHFKTFSKVLKTYVDEQCDVEYDDCGTVLKPSYRSDSIEDEQDEIVLV